MIPIDNILDKINESGIDSLSDSDRAILENYALDNKPIEELVEKIKQLKSNLRDIGKVMSKKDLDEELANYTLYEKYLPALDELFDLEDELISTYKIIDPTEVGLDKYSK